MLRPIVRESKRNTVNVLKRQKTETLSLFGHGVHLNTVLKVCGCIHLRLYQNNIHLWQKVASVYPKHTGENGTYIERHRKAASRNAVCREERDPRNHIYHETECNAFGLVVIGRQIFSHVAHAETS